jgi:hypothetical protein
VKDSENQHTIKLHTEGNITCNTHCTEVSGSPCHKNVVCVNYIIFSAKFSTREGQLVVRQARPIKYAHSVAVDLGSEPVPARITYDLQELFNL